MTLTPRDKRAILLGAAVIGAAAVVKFAALPLIDHWLEARQAIVMHRATLASLDQRVSRLGAMHGMLRPAYGDAIGKLPADVNTTRLTFHKNVQDLLKNAGIAFESIQPQDPRTLRDVDGIAIVGLRVTGSCQLPQLTKCLTSMRDGDHVIIVDNIDVTADEKKPGQLAVTMLLTTPAKGGGKR